MTMNLVQSETTINGYDCIVTIDTDSNTTQSLIQLGPGKKRVDLDPVTFSPITSSFTPPPAPVIKRHGEIV